MPIVDLGRLNDVPGVTIGMVKRILQVIGACEADARSIKKVVTRLFNDQQSILSDPDRFWSLQSFIVHGLQFASLKNFLGI